MANSSFFVSKPVHALTYLDGIRGIAAILVFFHHFLLAFYSSYYNWDMAASHLNGIEVTYGRSVFSFLSNCDFCVQIFFVLSGFVLSRKYFRINSFELVISGFHRRFIRLYIPVAFALIVSFVLMKTGSYFNQPVSRIAHSEWWFLGQWTFPNPFKELIKCLMYRTMLLGSNAFDTSMWTLSFEFYGSLFVFTFLAFTHFTRYRLLMLFLPLFYFYITDSTIYMSFVLGISLCYVEQWVEKSNKNYTVGFALMFLLFALVLGSYPTTNDRTGTIFEHIWPRLLNYAEWYHALGAYLLVVVFVISPLLQRMLSFKFFSFLGYISFSLYLLHPLVMGSFSSWLFLRLYNRFGYNHSVLMVFLSTILILIAASWLMAKYVDQYGIRLAKRVYQYLKKPTDLQTEQ